VLVKVSTLAEAEQFLRQNFRHLDVFVDATAISSAGDLVDVLNAGAAKILITLDQLTALTQEQSVPSSRLLVNALSDAELDTLQQWIAANASERNDVSVCTAPASISAAATKLNISSDSPRLYTTFGNQAVSEESVKSVIEQNAIAIVPSQALTFERDVAGKISAAKLIASRAVTDQSNGLYATSVTDERGSCLGFVWSSDESISEAIRTGTGVYQSRKRGLWYKGQSSGDTQELIRLGYDCDADCLVFVVKQTGRGKFQNLSQFWIIILTHIQASATSVLSLASVPLQVFLVFRRHSTNARPMPPPDLTPHVCSTSLSSSRQRSWRRPKSYVRRRPRRKSPLRLPIYFTSL
jgi:phosphoribosyl-ATP pyrophosphohydrolase/phosphoribosyl-AMP cyclohydrolase/histidinol dehydrogenase